MALTTAIWQIYKIYNLSNFKEKLNIDYKSYRNIISTLLKQSKKKYYDNYCKDEIYNMKNMQGSKSTISLQNSTIYSPKKISLWDQTIYWSSNNCKYF